MNRHVLVVLISLFLSSCKQKDTDKCSDSTALFLQTDYAIGLAVNADKYFTETVYQTIADKQFNSFTAENIFKARYLHPEENTYFWAEADALTGACIKNNKRMHGHTLIWHQDVPEWILNFTGSESEWEQLFKSHIQTIVLHFKGKVSAWDVVNEAFTEDGTLRKSIWQEKIGNTYIEKAFQYAHEADPNAQLFYNDYNLESNVNKRKTVLRYLNNLRNKGIKIDGIGLQMHVSISFPAPSQIADAFTDVFSNDYKVHVSEMDISVNFYGQDINPDKTLFEKQADYLGNIILHYKQIPPKYRYGITFWGLGDLDSWIPSYFGKEDYPLLYDNDYAPKPAYCKLIETL